MSIRRLATTGLAALGLALLIATPAQAAPGDATASGDAGQVSIRENGAQPVTVAPIAPCSSDGPAQGSAGDVSVANVVRFSDSESSCTVDAAGEVATATVTGGEFRLDALRDHGGPRIRLTGYTATCETTLTGSRSSVQLSGLTGVEAPSQLPANHVVTIPGPSGAPPIATVTFNETVIPSPADGSMTVHLMHVRLFPQGGPAAGDAYVGTVHCAPVG